MGMLIMIEFIIEWVLAAVHSFFGAPVPREIERAFFVASMSTEEALRRIPVPCTVIEIKQAYIDWPGSEEVRIRKSTQAGNSRYYRTHKAAISSGERSEREFKIGKRRYRSLLKRVLKNTDILYKDRICFQWRDQYFELDIFRKPNRLRRLARLEIELRHGGVEVVLPPFLIVLAEVTDSLAFANGGLAEKTRRV